MDFIVESSKSEGQNVILTAASRLTKMALFLPFAQFSFAMATDNLLVHHVFLLHGLPEHIISDCEQQYIEKDTS